MRASVLCTSLTSASIGVTFGGSSSSSSLELRRLFALALGSRRGRFAGVGGSIGGGLAVDVRGPRGRRRYDGGGGSRTVVGSGLRSGTISKCTRYLRISSVDNVVKSTCAAVVHQVSDPSMSACIHAVQSRPASHRGRPSSLHVRRAMGDSPPTFPLRLALCPLSFC